jgi:hypothetical protein
MVLKVELYQNPHEFFMLLALPPKQALYTMQIAGLQSN